MFDACRGRSAVSATHSNVSQTAGTVAFALARRARWPRVWAATQRLEMASVWATEARSRPYGAGRAVETLVGLSRRCGYPGTRVALWSKCGWVSPAPYAQRPHLADQRDRHHSDFWQPTVARSRPCQSPVERSETSFDWGVAACGRSGCCPTCTCITNALATLHLADQRAREASARGSDGIVRVTFGSLSPCPIVRVTFGSRDRQHRHGEDRGWIEGVERGGDSGDEGNPSTLSLSLSLLLSSPTL